MHRLLLTAACFWFALSFTWRIFGQDPADRPPIIEECRETIYQNGYVWYQLAGTRDRFGLWHRNQQVGIYDFTTGFYWSVENGKASRITTAPIRPPFARTNFGGEGHTFGVMSAKLDSRTRVWDSDGEYTTDYLRNLLEADLRDDSKAGHLSAIAKDPRARRKIEADYERVMQGNASATKIRFQAYDAEHPVNKLMLAPFRFDHDASYQRSGIAVIAQAPAADKDGKSRPHAWYDYRGEETLREGLRIVDPHYNPNPSPLPMMPWRINIADAGWLIAIGVVLGGLILIAAAFR